MSAEDRKSCSASLNDRFLVFALIYPGFLTISCKGFVRFRLSASREEESEVRQHLAEEEEREGGCRKCGSRQLLFALLHTISEKSTHRGNDQQGNLDSASL